MVNSDLKKWIAELAKILTAKKIFCATAESCTGGLIAASLTALPGSAQWFDCGLITYSNTSKQQLLDISPELFTLYGPVSIEMASAMAEGVIKKTQASVSVAITGLAGPAGDESNQPVGTICLAWAGRNHRTINQLYHLDGSRHKIRQTCVALAIKGLLDYAQSKREFE